MHGCMVGEELVLLLLRQLNVNRCGGKGVGQLWVRLVQPKKLLVVVQGLLCHAEFGSELLNVRIPLVCGTDRSGVSSGVCAIRSGNVLMHRSACT